MIKAFRDTWELGIHSYLTYLRDRLLLARELLSESGSVFVQISDENLHHVLELLEEIFEKENHIGTIWFRKKTMPLGSKHLEQMGDYIVWFGRNHQKTKFNRLYKKISITGDFHWNWREKVSGKKVKHTKSELKKNPDGEPFRLVSMWPPSYSEKERYKFPFRGENWRPPIGQCYPTTQVRLERAAISNRLEIEGAYLRYVMMLEDDDTAKLNLTWTDTVGARDQHYVVETSMRPIERCLLMTTDPGDLALDPTCGSGTTADVAEKWGRRWITCDTSRVAVTLAKQRLMTASYDYYALKYPGEGLRGGFIYETVPHIKLKSIANNPEIDTIYEQRHPATVDALAALNSALQTVSPAPFRVAEGARKGESVEFAAKPTEQTLPSGEMAFANALLEWEVPFEAPHDWNRESTDALAAFHAARQAMQQAMDASIDAHAGQEVLYDQPEIDKSKRRITGPFTVEAVPFATVLGLDEAQQPREADVAVARSGVTSRQAEWRDELLKTGIRGKNNQKLKLMDLEPLPGTRYIEAVGTVADTGERVAVSFGPEHAALEQRQVEIAMREAGDLFPLPKMLVFCAFTFDPEAAKDIDNIKGIAALKVQMNTDLLTEDLKKGRSSNESFWLMGQPEVELHTLEDGRYQIEVHGFDYFDTKSGELKSGGKKNIALWSLDTDYDNRSLFPRQVFFPMAGSKDGWYKLKKDIRAELNDDLLDAFHGTLSLPFEAGENECVAVKIVDDRGIESLKVINLG
jgi:adenine-specific DNA-methyltransferase